MNYIIDFYKGLDTVNLIIFWGVIIVVLLLLIFSIIMVNKNKKLERIIERNGIDTDDEEEDDDDDLAIKKEDEVSTIKEEIKEELPIIPPVIEKTEIHEEIKENPIDIPVKENKFVAEEHVMEYKEDFFELPTIKKQSEVKETISEPVNIPPLPEKKAVEVKEVLLDKPNAPYQRNILREVYPNQTSPIGNTRVEIHAKSDIEKARELNEILNAKEVSNNNENINIQRNIVHNNVSEPKIEKPVQKRGNYLEELSKKMAENSGVDRTEYELKQEQDAIISYKELMQKKDQIKVIDEEEAVISIEELQKKKLEEEKLYNITEREPNDDFINELKNFRSDL